MDLHGPITARASESSIQVVIEYSPVSLVLIRYCARL